MRQRKHLANIFVLYKYMENKTSYAIDYRTTYAFNYVLPSAT